MKNRYISNLAVLAAIGLLLMACDKNEVLPDYEMVGTSTATLAQISVSNDEPVAGEAITVTLYYVNLQADPVKEIKVLEQVGDGSFADLTTLDESSAQTQAEITRTLTYTVPAVAADTEIALDMVLSSQREYPQRERVTLTVQ